MRNAKVTTQDKLANAMIDKALEHVPFDGWSDQMSKKVCLELKISEYEFRQVFPRGGVDMALAFHRRDDERFVQEFMISEFNQTGLRVRDRIESAIINRLSIAVDNKESVRRSMSLFSTPLYFSEGTRALWATSDQIWVSIGDTSDDLNWYTKRLTLSSIYSAILIFWIEDESQNFCETRAFIKRRISDVMTIEKLKGKIRKSPIWGKFARRVEDSVSDIFKRKESFPGW